MDRFSRIRKIMSKYGATPEERLDILETVFPADDSLTTDLIVSQSQKTVKQSPDGEIPKEKKQDDFVPYKEIAEEYGYSPSGVRSAIDRPENGFTIRMVGKKRYISRAEWDTYYKTIANGPQSGKPSKVNTRDPKRLVKNWYSGGSSKVISNHEIRGWMTIPQCAQHTAIQEITIRNLIKKGLLTTFPLEKKDGTADVYGVHADEVYAVVRRGPRVVPDITVFERWDKVTAVADLFDFEQTELSKIAHSGDIASHRIGRYLYVHIGEVEKKLLK